MRIPPSSSHGLRITCKWMMSIIDTSFNDSFPFKSSGLTRRAIASATILSISNIGGVVGSFIYYDPPFYFAGNTITFCCFTAHAITVVIMRILLARENKRRAVMSPEQRQEEITKHGGESFAGDRHPDFRYVL